MQLFRHRRRPRSRGQGLVEFALVLPVFFLLVATAIDAGRLFFGYVMVTNAAKEGALYGAGNPRCPVSGTGCIDPNNVRYRVVQEAGGATNLTITNACTSPAGVTRITMTACAEGDSVRVTVSQPFGLVTPVMRAILGPSLTLSGSSSALVQNPGAYLAASPTPAPTSSPSPTPTASPSPGPSGTATAPPSPSPTPVATCVAPTITFSKIPSQPGPPPLSVTVTGVITAPAGSTPTSVLWTFGDGAEDTSWPSATHVYSAKGKYTVTLTVRTGAAVACATTRVEADFVHVN